eukprot:1608557-Rhodomonas_salina.1
MESFRISYSLAGNRHRQSQDRDMQRQTLCLANTHYECGRGGQQEESWTGSERKVAATFCTALGQLALNMTLCQRGGGGGGGQST